MNCNTTILSIQVQQSFPCPLLGVCHDHCPNNEPTRNCIRLEGEITHFHIPEGFCFPPSSLPFNYTFSHCSLRVVVSLLKSQKPSSLWVDIPFLTKGYLQCCNLMLKALTVELLWSGIFIQCWVIWGQWLRLNHLKTEEVQALLLLHSAE